MRTYKFILCKEIIRCRHINFCCSILTNDGSIFDIIWCQILWDPALVEDEPLPISPRSTAICHMRLVAPFRAQSAPNHRSPDTMHCGTYIECNESKLRAKHYDRLCTMSTPADCLFERVVPPPKWLEETHSSYCSRLMQHIAVIIALNWLWNDINLARRHTEYETDIYRMWQPALSSLCYSNHRKMIDEVWWSKIIWVIIYQLTLSHLT